METPEPNSKPSIDSLRVSKSKENVSIVGHVTDTSFKEPKKEENTNPKQDSQIETVFEKLLGLEDKNLDSDHSDITKSPFEIDKLEETKTEQRKSVAKIPPLDLEITDRAFKTSNENSVTEIKSTHSNNIYSVNGSPSGRIIKRRDVTSNVFPVGCMGCKEDEEVGVIGTTPSPRRFLDAQEASNDYAGHIKDTPRKRQSSAKKDERNPVTGIGVSKDEQRRQPSRRKDGNPLLGTGYDEPIKAVMSKSRVPPGGYSQGLW